MASPMVVQDRFLSVYKHQGGHKTESRAHFEGIDDVNLARQAIFVVRFCSSHFDEISVYFIAVNSGQKKMSKFNFVLWWAVVVRRK